VKTVNLLPDWYLTEKKQQKSLHLQFGLMLLLIAVMAGWLFVGHQRMVALRRQAVEREARVAVLPHNLAEEILATQTEIKRLENLQLAYRELGNTVPMSAVVQQIQNDLTQGMAISRVSIDVRPEPVKGSGYVGDLKNPPKYHDMARLTVVGVAPNDMQIAQLIGKVSGNPLFTDVSLNYTRTEILRDYNVRRFEIQMNMDLDLLATEVPTAKTEQQAHRGEGADHAG